MRFVTVLHSGEERAGVAVEGRVRALPSGTQLLDLLDIAGDDGTARREAGERAAEDGPDLGSLDEVHLLAPIPRPPTVRDFMTFESHIAGTVLNRGPDAVVAPQWYEAPAFYFTNPYAVIGPRDPVPVAPGSQMFDLELEVAAVVGRAGRDLHPDEAEDHIAGFTILVDWSARDVQFAEMQVNLGPAKGKDTATTMGPVLVTPDELQSHRSGPSYALDMTAQINGRRLGSDRLDNMAWSFGAMVAYASRGTEVRPGDVLGSGTCGGGCLAEMWGRHGPDGHPPLQPGDTVTVTVQELGSMTLSITDGVAPLPIPRARRREDTLGGSASAGPPA